MVDTAPFRVFLSHSSNDANLAKEIARQIETEFNNELKVFVSTRADAIPSGEDWEDDVIRKLDAADVLVFLMTGHSENSVWVGCELGYFWKKSGKAKIHTLYHPTAKVPSPLDTIQAKVINDKASLESFFKGICGDLGKAYAFRADINAIIETANTLLIKPPERSLQNFERLLSESEWEKVNIGSSEVWLCVDDVLFQIIEDDYKEPFGEPWCNKVPTVYEPMKQIVKLMIAGVAIREAYFVNLDDWRYFVPLPKIEVVDSDLGKYQYYWQRNSLQFKLGEIIGHFYSVAPTIEQFAELCGIEIRD